MMIRALLGAAEWYPPFGMEADLADLSGGSIPLMPIFFGEATVQSVFENNNFNKRRGYGLSLGA